MKLSITILSFTHNYILSENKRSQRKTTSSSNREGHDTIFTERTRGNH